MASFIAETLAASGAGDAERFNLEISELSTKSDELKLELMTSLKSKYENFDSRLDETSSLYTRWQQVDSTLTSTSNAVKKELESKLKASADHLGVTDELDKVKVTLSILEKLIEVHQLHESAKGLLTSHDFTQTTVELGKMGAALKQLEQDAPGLDIIKTLRVEHTTLDQSLKQSMTEEWNSIVQISKQDPTNDDSKTVVFTIQTSRSRSHLTEFCKALHSQNMLTVRLKSLSESLKMAFDWIINYPKTTVTEESTDGKIDISVTRTANNISPSWPSSVYKSLYRLMKPLAQRLLSISVADSEDSPTVMTVLRELCGTVPIDTIIKGCLSPSVPTNQSDLDKYKDVVTETEKIQDFFQKIGFVSPGSNSLTSYLGNLNVLFANKKCQQILSQARKLMKADLYNTVRLQPGDDCTKWSSFVAKMESQLDTADSPTTDISSRINKLSDNTLKFPSCAISTTTVELLTLAHGMMEEACSTDNAACSTQIVYAMRSMFELYTSVVSDYHRHSIDTLPQVAALYYNNCMFLSHQLIMLANQYKARLTKILQDGSAITFVDLVPLLRALGTESFLDQIQFQKENLSDCLRAAEGFKNMEVEERFRAAHQSIKQCMHQLNHLKKVWIDVLPASNYSKSVGHLLAFIVKEMITSVTSLEDMSADDTTKLHQLITEVQGAAPQLFPGDKSSALGLLIKHCPGWNKLNELGIVLTASLHDVVERWAEAKGPLALEFSPEQVKALIRALFQNTERRAAALAKIY